MKIAAVDLFCGAGGTSSGLWRVPRRWAGLDLVAVDHWQVAIETHSANLPGRRQFARGLRRCIPREVVPGGYLRLLCASPECTHHSVARGGVR
jgi:DNA (cytosine-5)-methyltransferase 1